MRAWLKYILTRPNYYLSDINLSPMKIFSSVNIYFYWNIWLTSWKVFLHNSTFFILLSFQILVYSSVCTWLDSFVGNEDKGHIKDLTWCLIFLSLNDLLSNCDECPRKCGDDAVRLSINELPYFSSKRQNLHLGFVTRYSVLVL